MQMVEDAFSWNLPLYTKGKSQYKDRQLYMYMISCSTFILLWNVIIEWISLHTLFWFGLWFLTPLSTIFQLYCGGQFCCQWKKTGVSGENHWPAASHWQTLSHNVISSTPPLSGIQTHNVSGDRHWLHR